MSEQPKTQTEFERIETVSSGYFTYIIGRFRQPDVYALGAMDLTDPASWSGGETAVVFYFLITPEEYSWLTEDRPRLDALAQKIQTNMPKSRFFSATCTKKGMKPAELKTLCDQALKEDALEGDEAFDAWKKTVRLPRRVLVPKTPFNEARHNLAVCQKTLQPKTAPKEELDRALELERKLGWLIFKADAVYAAYDRCFNPRFPMIETARGDVHIWSSQELAETSAKYYADNHYYDVEIRKVEQKDIKAFLRMCEELGVVRFRLDDGLEPVTIRLNSIIPNHDRGFIENYNCHIRNLMLRTMQTLRLFKLHGEEMDETRRRALNDWFMTWNRMMLQDIGKTTLFVPCGLPAKLYDQLKGQCAYSDAGLKNIQDLMQSANQTGRPIEYPGYKGRRAIVRTDGQGKIPIRVVKTQDEKRWLAAFTSREDAERFVQKSNHTDVVVGLTLDELAAQTAGFDGVLVDPASIALSLTEEKLNEALKIRDDKRLIFQSKAPDEAEQAAQPQIIPQQPEIPDVLPQEAAVPDPPIPAETEQAAEPGPAQPDGSPASGPAEDPKKKGGFFGRFFGKL